MLITQISLLIIFFLFLFVIYAFINHVLDSHHNWSKMHACEHEVNIPIDFELVEETGIKKILEFFAVNKEQIKINNTYFDTHVFISSDYKIIKSVLQNSEIQNIVLDLIKERNIYGVFIKNGQIKLKIKSTNKHNHTKIVKEIDEKYDTKVLKLGQLLEKEISQALSKETRSNKEFAASITANIQKIHSFSFSMLVVSFFWCLYFLLIDMDKYFHIDKFPFWNTYTNTLNAFLIVLGTFLILTITKGSVRKHLLASTYFFSFLPATILTSIVLSYHVNIGLYKTVEISTENIRYHAKRSGKNMNYYMIIQNPQNPLLQKDVTYPNVVINVSRLTYQKIIDKKTGIIYVYEGLLGKRFIELPPE